jgi:hypothetical protein
MSFRLAALTALSLSFASVSGHAAVQIINSPDAFLADQVIDFESGIPASGSVVFSATAELGQSSMWTDNVTPSGRYGIVQAVTNGPLIASFSAPMSAVGFYFGNDDFGYSFDVILKAYQGSDLVGSVSRSVNRNDYADQFLGLISDVSFTSVTIEYQRPAAQQLSVYVDDFRFAAAVPEPSALMLGAVGLALLAVSKRRGVRG